MDQLTATEARIIKTFAEDMGLEYLAEYCDDNGIELDDLLDKLGRIASSFPTLGQ